MNSNLFLEEADRRPEEEYRVESDALISNGFAFSDAIFINAYVKVTMMHLLRHLFLLALTFKGLII